MCSPCTSTSLFRPPCKYLLLRSKIRARGIVEHELEACVRKRNRAGVARFPDSEQGPDPDASEKNRMLVTVSTLVRVAESPAVVAANVRGGGLSQREPLLSRVDWAMAGDTDVASRSQTDTRSQVLRAHIGTSRLREREPVHGRLNPKSETA